MGCYKSANERRPEIPFGETSLATSTLGRLSWAPNLEPLVWMQKKAIGHKME